jgi:hypothetical protein
MRPPHAGLAMASCHFYFILNHHGHSHPRLIFLIISNLSTLPSPPLSLSSPCADLPPSSQRGSQTVLTLVALPTISHPHPQVQVPPPIRPFMASPTESRLVVSLAPSPGSLSQPNDRKGPPHSQSLPTPRRLPPRARSHFAHQTMTVLVIWRRVGEPGFRG